MKKSSVKISDNEKLNLKWDAQAMAAGKEKPAKLLPPSRLEEYFDFLEAIGPLPRDDTPEKLYKERFVV